MNHLKLFLRNLLRNRLYTFITVGGFAISLTFVILLSIYIRQELSVDGFQVNKDRIYRMAGEDGACWGALVGGQMKDAFPDIETYTRVYDENGYFAVSPGGNKIVFQGLFVDTSFLDMFSFPLQEGRFFRAKNEVVLSASFARKLFGKESPLGKDLNLNGDAGWPIVGIIKDFPDNTHFNHCDVLANFTCMNAQWISTNNSSVFGTYLLEKPGGNLKAKLPLIKDQLKKDFWMYQDNYRKEFLLEPLKEVYWSDKYACGTHHNSRMFVSVLMAIVAVILILSLINYNNLSVARAGFRAKESAVKKLLGSNNKALFIQFITESVVLCFLALGLACVLAVLVLPWFNDLLDTHLVLAQHITLYTLTGIVLAVALIGVIAGLTPAWIIIRFNPVEVVKGAFRKKTKGEYSKILISFQYCVAITLIICTLVVWRQTDFMRNYKLGFDKENVVWLESKISAGVKGALRNELEQVPGVKMVSFVQGTPIDGGNNQTMTNYAGTGKQISFQQFKVDSNFFKMLDIRITPTGVAYDPTGVWLNETAVKTIGVQGIPEEFAHYDHKVPVLGVMKDFHIEDLTSEMTPVFVSLLQPDEYCWNILVKISPENPAGTFDRVKKVYSRFIHEQPFESGFMDQTINTWYEDNARTARLVGYFSVLAIILCMMGILAMATYFIQQRIKEIGIRRVNGATVSEILRMLMNSFMKWVLLAFAGACPVAWYVMSRWLQDFPYRTNLSIWLFLGAGLAAFIVAASMVGWQSVKAASENPVKALKND